MKTLLRDLAEGTIVKMEENGALADFVVAKHNYENSLNGTGKTVMVRLTPLDELRPWGTLYGYHTGRTAWWSRDSTLRTWLEKTYAGYFSESDRAKIVPITIKEYCRGSGTGTLSDASFFVPGLRDIIKNSSMNDGDFFGTATIQTIADNLGKKVCWMRATDYIEDDDDDEEYVVARSFHATKSQFASGPLETNSINSGTQPNMTDGRYVLPCFAMDANATALGDDGVLRGNRAPEISSYYFGTETVHGKSLPFKVPYSVHDEDGDEITVTEYLDDIVVRRYIAKDGVTNQFTMTQELMDSISGEEDHVLKVSATDGIDTAEKTYQLRKMTGSGYTVYVGQIAGTDDGTGYYWTEREVLHDPASEDMPIVLDPEVTLEKNNFGSFVFTVPVSNPYCDKIKLKKSVISVEEDGSEIFMGYVTEMEKNFDLDLEVTCEGELGYLQDRDCIVEEKAYTTTELVTLALTDISSEGRFAKEGKTFNVGTISRQKPEEGKDDKETKGVSDCWSVLNNLVNDYGGYLRMRKVVKMENGVRTYRRYLDYLTDIPDRTDQMIQFGVNLLDISYYLKANTIVNSLIVIGYETSGWFIFTSTNEIRVEVKNEKSIQQYGLCQRIMTVDGTKSTKDSLLKKGEEELKKYSGNLFGTSITINAADLADVGVDVDRLEFMKNTRVISEAHGLKDWVLCTKEVIPLDAPEEKEFTFGDSVDNLSAIQASSFGTAGKAWNAVQSTIQYVRSK